MMNKKINASDLHTFAEKVFQAAGALQEDAKTAAAARWSRETYAVLTPTG
ncbi:MAG: hypothetical protein ABSH06_18130 [Thermodesulfobacteriota bacterium]